MRWIWLFWFVLIIVSFAALEGYALSHDKVTLSFVVWELSQAWPPLPFVVGNVTGALAVHFWWRWNPVPDQQRTTHGEF